MTESEGLPAEATSIGFKVLRFGESIAFEDGLPFFADEGDIMAIFPHENGNSSVIVMDPEQALRTAEALIEVAKIGSDMQRRHQGEVND